MADQSDDAVGFDEARLLALAHDALPGEGPGADVRARLITRVAETSPVPRGFAFSFSDEGWQQYPLPGIRLKVLAVSKSQETATILIDAGPGARFPPHHHGGDEECYVISGDVNTLGRRMGPGDFLHAEAGTDHGELYTEHGALVLLVVHPEDYIPGFVRSVADSPTALG